MGPESGSRASRPFALTPLAFVLALAVYIVLGLLLKSVFLNWIVGPTFPLVVLYLLPKAFRRDRDRRPDGGER